MISKYNKFLKEKQMRDILNLFDSVLTEEKLSAAQMPITKASGVVNPKNGKLYNRQELFLIKVKTSSPFTSGQRRRSCCRSQRSQKRSRMVGYWSKRNYHVTDRGRWHS
jgi:hypothetical protein